MSGKGQRAEGKGEGKGERSKALMDMGSISGAL
jgi:hypothetical protein